MNELKRVQAKKKWQDLCAKIDLSKSAEEKEKLNKQIQAAQKTWLKYCK